MQVELSTVTKIKLTHLQEMSAFRLDPLTVILDNFEPGRGKIIIECFGESWSASWAAMGKRTIAQFFCNCDEHYLAKNLSGISGDLPDYEKLGDTARQEVCRLRRESELTKDEARDLFEDAGRFSGAETSHDLDGSAMQAIFGDEWWHSIPDKPNPDYEYLCRVINAVQAGIREAGLLSQEQEQGQ